MPNMITSIAVLILLISRLNAAQLTSCDENKLMQAKALFRCETQYSGKECNSNDLSILTAGLATLVVTNPEELKQMKLVHDFHNELIALRKKIASEHKQILNEYTKYLKKNKLPFRDGATEIQLKDLEPIINDLLKKYPDNQMLKSLIAKSKLTSTDRPVAINDVIQNQFSDLFERIQTKLDYGSKFKSLSAMTLGEHVSYSLNNMKIEFVKKAYLHDQDNMSAKVERLQSENKIIKSEYQMARTQMKTMAKYLARAGVAGVGGAAIAAQAAAGTLGEIATFAGQTFEKGELLKCLENYKINISPEASSLLFQNLVGVQKIKSTKSEPICNRTIVNSNFIDYILFEDSPDNLQMREFVCRLYDNRFTTYDKTFIKPRPIIFDPFKTSRNEIDTVVDCFKIKTPINKSNGGFIEIDINNNDGRWTIETLKSNNAYCNNWINTRIKYNPSFKKHQKFQLFQPQFICEYIGESECQKSLCELSRATLETSQNFELRKLQCALAEDSMHKHLNRNQQQEQHRNLKNYNNQKTMN